MNGQQKSYYQRGGEEPLLKATIPEHFSSVILKFPDREAVVSCHQSRRLSYRQLSDAVDQLARGLLGIGFAKGHRIGVWSTNNIEWLLLQMATARIGAVLVNINPAYRPRELAYALERSEVQGLFVIPAFRSSDYVAMLLELMPELAVDTHDGKHKDFPALRRIVIFDPSNPEETLRPHPGFMVWQEVLAAAETISLADLDAVSNSLHHREAINIQYTSGTTGSPKAVLLSHYNILNNALFTARAMHFTENDRLCVPVPFYHCFGMVVSNLLCLSVGACIVLPSEYFDARAVLQTVQQERCTALHGVPTMFIAELELPEFSEFELGSLRTGIMAGAPCPPALMEQVMQDLHCPEILIGYGETEASPLTHLTTRDDNLEHRTQTVGRNLPHQEVKIVDLKTRVTVPLGETGEICFRGYHVMQGYYGQPEKTAETIDEHGWLASGDLGSMDADGYLTITGRLKEMIIRGGENIYPREIEDYLFTHPKVAEVAVFGIPDKFYGEEVMAWIVLHNSESVTVEKIREFCEGNIAHFKIPKHIWFVDEFPLTVTGKPQKFRMREMALEKLAKGDR